MNDNYYHNMQVDLFKSISERICQVMAIRWLTAQGSSCMSCIQGAYWVAARYHSLGWNVIIQCELPKWLICEDSCNESWMIWSWLIILDFNSFRLHIICEGSWTLNHQSNHPRLGPMLDDVFAYDGPLGCNPLDGASQLQHISGFWC